MTDRFTEQLVKKNPSSQDNAKKIAVIAGLLILIAGTAFLAITSGLLIILTITIGLIYLGYYLLTGMGVEYEYTFTNGELDIDKIIGQRKRQNLITVDTSKFEDFGVVTADTPEKPDATLILCSDNTGEGEYYADLTTEEYGETRIIFTPGEKMAGYIEESLPRNLRYRKQHGI